MIHRPGGVTLSPEEAARYDDEERSNLRSWGIGVPEPFTCSPDEEVPIEEPLIFNSSWAPLDPWIGKGIGQMAAMNQTALATGYYPQNIGSAYPAQSYTQMQATAYPTQFFPPYPR